MTDNHLKSSCSSLRYFCIILQIKTLLHTNKKIFCSKNNNPITMLISIILNISIAIYISSKKRIQKFIRNLLF
nr:MAG TPA: hypothetical protein [Caudoviricetes sp.]